MSSSPLHSRMLTDLISCRACAATTVAESSWGQQPCQQAEDPALVRSTLTSDYYNLPPSSSSVMVP